MKSHSARSARASRHCATSRKASIPIRKKIRSDFFEGWLQASHRVDRIVRGCGFRLSPGRLQQRRHKSPIVLRGERHHDITMNKRCEWLFLFVRRDIRRHKQHLSQRIAAGSRLRQCQVPAMDGVEAAAEKADIHSDTTCPACPCDASLVSSLPGIVARRLASPVARLCSPNPFLYQRVLRKPASETRLWTRHFLSSIRCPPRLRLEGVPLATVPPG